MTEIPLLTFDELFDLLEENKNVDLRVKNACEKITICQQSLYFIMLADYSIFGFNKTKTEKN